MRNATNKVLADRYDGIPMSRPDADTLPPRPECSTPGCGDSAEPRLEPGWVRVQAYGDFSRAYCSSTCVTRALVRHDLRSSSC